MIHRTIPLREDDSDITLTTYVADERWKTRDAMLVLPGGGYSCVCDDREGEPIALSFLAKGINAFVLKYSVKEKALFPRPLADASLAMAYLKDHAEAFCINPDRIFCVGFSAGGHLAASLGTLWHLPEVSEMTGLPYGKNKPAGMILCYPVITASEKWHAGSFHYLLGTETPTPEERLRYSIEKHVDRRTVPAFLMHTANDTVVPVENSLLMAQALSRAKVPFEMHIYPEGPHGIALANWLTEKNMPQMTEKAVARWVEDAVYWMENKVRPIPDTPEESEQG